MRLRCITMGAVALAVAAVWAAPAAAGVGGKWSKTFTVTAHCGCSDAPLVAGSTRYGFTIAWVGYSSFSGGDEAADIWARRVRRDGSLAPKRKLGSVMAFNDKAASIAAGASGAIVVAWQAGDGGIHARRISPRGKIGRAHRISSSGGGDHEVSVAVDGRGNALIAWSGVWSISSQGSSAPVPPNVHVRRLSAKGDVGRTVGLHPESGFHDEARVAISPSGHAMVVWRNYAELKAASVDPNGTVGPLLDVASGAGAPGDVAVDAQGRATVIWQSGTVNIRRIDPAGTLGPIHVPAPGPGFRSGGRVALDSKGSAIFTWSSRPEGFTAPAVMESWRLDANDAVGPVATLSPEGLVPGDLGDGAPLLALDGRGDATLVWQRATRIGQTMRFATLARRLAPDGTLGPVHTLADGSAGVSFPGLAVDARGVALAAWNTGVADVSAIKAARFVPRRPAGAG